MVLSMCDTNMARSAVHRQPMLITKHILASWIVIVLASFSSKITMVQAAVLPELSAPLNLNVGGTSYTTTRATLTSSRATNSKLAEMFSTANQLPLQDTSGRFFLDRNGRLFGYVLDFLRTGAITATSAGQQQELVAEAAYFGLTQMLAELYRTSEGDGTMIQVSIGPNKRAQWMDADHIELYGKKGLSVYNLIRIMWLNMSPGNRFALEDILEGQYVSMSLFKNAEIPQSVFHVALAESLNAAPRAARSMDKYWSIKETEIFVLFEKLNTMGWKLKHKTFVSYQQSFHREYVLYKTSS